MTAAGITLGDAMAVRSSGSFSDGGAWYARPDHEQAHPEVLAVLCGSEGGER